MIAQLALALVAITTGAHFSGVGATGCILSQDETPMNPPVLSNEAGKIYPENINGGNIILSPGSITTVSCTPASNTLQNYGVNELDVQSLGDQLVIEANGETTSYGQLGCSRPVREELVESETCYKGLSSISIEFSSATKRLPVITLCHNRTDANTLYSHHTLYGASASVAEISNRRPSFKKAQFYGKVSPDSAYEQKSQLEIMKKLVGSATLANEYIAPSQSFYFARGHLSPDGDFIYVSEQNATYYFVNVIPQWQAINNGNWKAMEMAVRNLAAKGGSSLDVYTGGYSTLQLKDVNDNLVDIYLAKDPSTDQYVLPVPKLTWKIVHDSKAKTATVIVMVNNPHDLGITSNEIICKDVCDQINWVTWDTKNVRKGYTYCCSLSTFRKKVPYAPNLGSLKLLS